MALGDKRIQNRNGLNIQYVSKGVILLPDGTTGDAFVEDVNTGAGGGGAGDASAANQVTTNTRLGDIIETAPATDTASSGLNGRLQRIAQRLTSIFTTQTDGTQKSIIRTNAKAGTPAGEPTSRNLSATVQGQDMIIASAIDGLGASVQPTDSDSRGNQSALSVGGFNYGFNNTTWDRLRAGITGVITSPLGIQNILSMGRFNALPPTLLDGNMALLQLDNRGNIKTAEQTVPDYEDNAADKAVVEHRYLYRRCIADTLVKTGTGLLHTVTISSSATGGVAGVLTIFDSITETGTVLYSEHINAGVVAAHTLTLDVLTDNGVFVGYDATLTNVQVTLSYR